MLISVVIPVFNVETVLLKRSIGSVLDSHNSEVEVVVVDDGSYDCNSKAYADLCKVSPLVRYVKKENGGPSSARNFGVDNANGQYVLFLDADDYLTNTCINEAITVCNENQADVVMGYVYKIYGGRSIDKTIISHSELKSITVSGKTEKAKLLNHILGYRDDMYRMDPAYISDGPVCRFFKKSLFGDNRFDLTPVWNEDTLWNIGLINSADKISVLKSVWYIYDVRPKSVTQGFRENCPEEFSYITKRVYETGKLLWGGLSDKGIYYRVWHDIFFLSRCYVFHSNMSSGFVNKFKVLTNAFKEETFKEAVRGVDFSCENSKSKRVVKEALRGTMRMHFFLLSYLIICLYTKRGHA